MTTTTTTTTTIEAIRSHPAVESVNPWNDRYYLNLSGYHRSFRGDVTAKLWVNTKGEIVREAGKGTRSPEFASSFTSVLAYAESEGIPVIKR